MSLLARLQEIRLLRNVEQYDEASAKQTLILPILKELGWDPFNRDEVYPEYPLDDKKLDYCLKIGTVPKVFIEAKKPAEELERHEEQLLQYSFKHNVGLAILTNGIVWWFYLPISKESIWRERKFIAIDIKNQEPSDTNANFIFYLDKGRVAAGSAIEQAEDIDILFGSKKPMLIKAPS